MVRKNPSVVTLVILLSVIAMTTHNLTEERSILIVIGMLISSSARIKGWQPYQQFKP
jgi:uncharacterized membrane protein YhhN